ncbi:Cytochrome c, mono-and diheme variants [Paraburkholderia fungorum]|uniref:Cytochrome c, mono-and diheme variants n=1 Tax=Paraburkholderia fungorum TaxID=134537 RepID=A0A1H1K0C1_9BURK|nr:cytochrome c [Paraburkholderia fungorum]SDR55512.1 Cytochrome c, mono-and diheme variants [Paraburkholderia fungorum]
MAINFKRIATTIFGLAGIAAVIYGVGVTWDLHRTYTSTAQDSDAPDDAQLARGRYVAYSADCAACHTAPGAAPFAGGYPLATPFGKILSSNITSDKDTGIGSWTLAQFDRAVRHGQGSHGYLYPAMPYTSYARMTDADVRDLWAYVHSLAPVNHRVVEDQLPFPYSQRWLLGGWNLLFFRAQPFRDDSTKSVEYNRGAYLVEGAGHCAACHTAKNFLGGDSAAFLQGGSLAGWYAPDLTANPHVGVGAWSVDDIATYLATGSNEKAVSSGPMTEAIENSTQHLTSADLHAIGVYLKAQRSSSDAPAQPVAATDAAMVLGKRVYESQCIACHVSNGSGIRRMIPAFVNSPTLLSNNPATLLHIVLMGEDGPQTHANPTGAGMPRFDWKLSDDEVAAVLTYTRNSWGNAAPAVSAGTVAQARKQLVSQNWIGH